MLPHIQLYTLWRIFKLLAALLYLCQQLLVIGPLDIFTLNLTVVKLLIHFCDKLGSLLITWFSELSNVATKRISDHILMQTVEFLENIV